MRSFPTPKIPRTAQTQETTAPSNRHVFKPTHVMKRFDGAGFAETSNPAPPPLPQINTKRKHGHLRHLITPPHPPPPQEKTARYEKLRHRTTTHACEIFAVAGYAMLCRDIKFPFPQFAASPCPVNAPIFAVTASWRRLYNQMQSNSIKSNSI